MEPTTTSELEKFNARKLAILERLSSDDVVCVIRMDEDVSMIFGLVSIGCCRVVRRDESKHRVVQHFESKRGGVGVLITDKGRAHLAIMKQELQPRLIQWRRS